MEAIRDFVMTDAAPVADASLPRQGLSFSTVPAQRRASEPAPRLTSSAPTPAFQWNANPAFKPTSSKPRGGDVNLADLASYEDDSFEASPEEDRREAQADAAWEAQQRGVAPSIRRPVVLAEPLPELIDDYEPDFDPTKVGQYNPNIKTHKDAVAYEKQCEDARINKQKNNANLERALKKGKADLVQLYFRERNAKAHSNSLFGRDKDIGAHSLKSLAVDLKEKGASIRNAHVRGKCDFILDNGRKCPYNVIPGKRFCVKHIYAGETFHQ